VGGMPRGDVRVKRRRIARHRPRQPPRPPRTFPRASARRWSTRRPDGFRRCVRLTEAARARSLPRRTGSRRGARVARNSPAPGGRRRQVRALLPGLPPVPANFATSSSPAGAGRAGKVAFRRKPSSTRSRNRIFAPASSSSTTISLEMGRGCAGSCQNRGPADRIEQVLDVWGGIYPSARVTVTRDAGPDAGEPPPPRPGSRSSGRRPPGRGGRPSRPQR